MEQRPDGKMKPPKDVRFRSSIPSTHDDGSPIHAEWHLRCPKCDYELTGLTTRRCPECGRRFDPHAVWAGQRRKNAEFAFRTPAYVLYAVLGFVLLATLPLYRDNLVVLAPLGVLPVYEATAFFMGRDAEPARQPVIGLALMGCVVLWGIL